VDGDQDGVLDALEVALGSSAGDAASMRGGPAGAPLRLSNRVNALPSYLGRNPGCWAYAHDELCALPPPGSYL
jgi:hypothetical protein